METLTDIQFDLNVDRLMEECRVEPGSSDEADLRCLVKLARDIGRPKAAYNTCFITERDGTRIRIDDTWFESRALVHNLQSVERVFPLVATCGPELDNGFADKGNMLKEFWWDVIKTRLLGAANRHLSKYLHRRFRLNKTATMHPGSGDASVWPIEQQRELFSLFGDVEGQVGVQLTDSFLMIPNKTTSGLLFPTETDFRSCEVCHRENCPSRHAEFNKELWEAIQHD